MIKGHIVTLNNHTTMIIFSNEVHNFILQLLDLSVSKPCKLLRFGMFAVDVLLDLHFSEHACLSQHFKILRV